MKLFFTSYVRPLLEFSSPVWNPISKRRRFCKLSRDKISSRKRRLEILSLDSLQKRRLVADLVCLFSIISGSSNTFLYPYIIFDNPSVTRSHNLRLSIPLFNLSASHQNLISRTAPFWNKLPLTILAANSKLLFRRRISSFLADPHRSASWLFVNLHWLAFSEVIEFVSTSYFILILVLNLVCIFLLVYFAGL